MTEPTHARTQYDALTEQRDYPDYICPGRHCRGLSGWRDGEHRHNPFPIHSRNPAAWDPNRRYHLKKESNA